MTDIDGLIEQLKGRSEYLRKLGRVKSPDLMDAAATAMRELREERDRLASAMSRCLLGTPPGDCYAAEAADLRRAQLEMHAELSRLYGCRDELQDATRAIDDPAVNNIRTLPDAIRALRAQLEECRKDGERVDWLEGELQREEQGLPPGGSLFRRNMPITRAAIDAAIAKEGKG